MHFVRGSCYTDFQKKQGNADSTLKFFCSFADNAYEQADPIKANPQKCGGAKLLGSKSQGGLGYDSPAAEALPNDTTHLCRALLRRRKIEDIL